MVKGSLEPEIEKRWKKLLFSRGLNYYLAMSMAKLKTVDTELCLRTVKSLTTMHSVGLSKLVDVFKAFSELGEEVP